MIRHLCVLCDGPADGRDLCAGCHRDLPWLGRACRRCAAPLPPRSQRTCGRCRERPTLQAATVAALRYEFPVDRLLHKLKFGKSLPPGRVLGELLADAVAAARAPARVDAVVAVPLHASRLRERGFNQSLEIARPVAAATGLPLLARACRRTRHAVPQSTLTGAERRRDLAGSYTADAAAVAGRRIAVVDDVYTTGTTVAAVTDALLHAGAARVEAWCVARASG